jgi:hypothetical protein
VLGSVAVKLPLALRLREQLDPNQAALHFKSLPRYQHEVRRLRQLAVASPAPPPLQNQAERKPASAGISTTGVAGRERGEKTHPSDSGRTPSLLDPATPTMPALYVCFERSLVDQVKATGYSSRRRPNVAVETSVEKAISGYQNHHKEDFAVFLVLPGSAGLGHFRNRRGSWRLSGRHVPPTRLLQVQ